MNNASTCEAIHSTTNYFNIVLHFYYVGQSCLLKAVAAEHPLIIIDIAWAFQVFNSLFAHHSTRTLSEQSQVYLSRHLAMDTEDLSSQQ